MNILIILMQFIEKNQEKTSIFTADSSSIIIGVEDEWRETAKEEKKRKIKKNKKFKLNKSNISLKVN